MARVLVLHGQNYVAKFQTKTGGFVILAHYLERWWKLPAIWPICFCVLFGVDVAKVDTSAPLELFFLMETFQQEGKAKVAYPEMWRVMASMLKTGVEAVVNDRGPESPPPQISGGRKIIPTTNAEAAS